MATISSLGVGANLDLASLLTQLETAEKQPMVALQAKAKSYTSKLSAYGTIQSALATLQTAAKKLGDPTLFQSVTGTPTVSGILSATATDASAAGNYTIDVTQLAQAQTVVSAGQADTKTAIGNGKITIDFGAVSGGTLDAATGKYTGATFTADASQTAKSITIDPTNNTLEGIRNAINGANAGVTASIVNDGSGTPNRLVLTSSQTGEKSSMRISVDGDAALQNLLNNDPAGTQNLKQTAAAQNAKLNVNGIDITSATNTVKEAIQGATLTLVNTGKTGLSMKENTASAKTAINDFVKAYNALQSTATSLTTYDADTNTAAALVGDSTLRNLQTRIRQALTTPQAGTGNSMKVLTEIGVSFQKDGTLAVDSDKLDKALANNLKGVANMFSSATGSTAGYGKQIDALVDDVTKGSLKVASDGVTATIKELDTQYDAMQLRVDSTVARYRAQFNQLDVLINKMNNTKNYLTQQFEAMSSSSK
ncbi:flagellar filament capping protein FliD [Variovorax sp. NFACC27]|uniref:flagellar filament capping protein FliD n=1 Tax=unclassified Variovorax TaxID=663243 RepID=UPI0008989C53|nr:flagellar hook-associated protein 2 [Variovorax sp. NFACC28]SEG61772.1 flagellar hook-associated protein 2 [Variovorax sp. NFACC29]SFC62211.1 flagellar hook-associated protein 2 [Variovorax sp. NFACC26]SFG68603.1 flagellar hook-associated protein 2 [Variovorax sp. NFACC27]